MIDLDLLARLLVGDVARRSAALTPDASRVRGASRRRARRTGGRAPLLLARPAMEMGYWALRRSRAPASSLGVTRQRGVLGSLALGVPRQGSRWPPGTSGWAPLSAAASAICDALDGMVARETGTACDAGEVLDAAVDRYAELLFLGGHRRLRRPEPVPGSCRSSRSRVRSWSATRRPRPRPSGVEAPRGAMRRQERAVYLVARRRARARRRSPRGPLRTCPTWVARSPSSLGALAPRRGSWATCRPSRRLRCDRRTLYARARRRHATNCCRTARAREGRHAASRRRLPLSRGRRSPGGRSAGTRLAPSRDRPRLRRRWCSSSASSACRRSPHGRSGRALGGSHQLRPRSRLDLPRGIRATGGTGHALRARLGRRRRPEHARGTPDARRRHVSVRPRASARRPSRSACWNFPMQRRFVFRERRGQ